MATDTNSSAGVKTGGEQLISNHLPELEGKNIGLVMNPTAVVDGVHMLDTLMALDVDIAALFAPEHGFRGEAGAGEKIEDGVDQQTGLPVYSLYGSTRKPTPEMLEGIDILLFDMQDVGARFYTYHATMGLVIEAAADAGIPVWILDRPNPLSGEYVSGWIREDEFSSFVGPYPIPVAHGMTLGELAQMIAGEGWLDTDAAPNVRVIEMAGWNRSMLWPDTDLPWIAPSPNLPTFEHAYVYLGTCLIEGTSLSEGRGTADPFLTLGSPNTILTEDQIDRLNSRITGGTVAPAVFTPREIPGVALNPKHEGKESYGIRLTVNDYNSYQPFENGLIILSELMQSTPEATTRDFIYKLAGSKEIDRIISGELQPSDADFYIEPFMNGRDQYLIY
ncbi:exo-beta-N-acetylmuramidase NamZ family protein [Rhodohalobacter sp. 8-1]|uniref:exo-beta-N-acetylmuramidase NamZ family protein n=1 Tax=Rhodohalobacter sp. 8-1 TaxID=3131972 RepID=UPI0030EFA2E5